MADPTQPPPSIMQKIIGALSGRQGAANIGQAGANPQQIQYNNYVREQKAMGAPVAPFGQWVTEQSAPAPQAPQPAAQPPGTPGFRF